MNFEECKSAVTKALKDTAEIIDRNVKLETDRPIIIRYENCVVILNVDSRESVEVEIIPGHIFDFFDKTLDLSTFSRFSMTVELKEGGKPIE